MAHLAQLLVDGERVAVFRNMVPMAWPFLIQPDAITRREHVAFGERFETLEIRCPAADVSARLQRLSDLGHPLFFDAERAANWFRGADLVEFDVNEVLELADDPRPLEAALADAPPLLERVGPDAIWPVLERMQWGFLRAGDTLDLRRATRYSRIQREYELRFCLAFGGPCDPVPFEDRWNEGPPCPEVSTREEDAEAVLAILEAKGVVRVHERSWAIRYVAAGLSVRTVESTLQGIEAARSLGNLEVRRSWLGRSLLTDACVAEALAALPD